MEDYITNIELINHYLKGVLSEKEILDFETQLRTNPKFKATYEQHCIFKKGLERLSLQREIGNAAKSYSQSKWLRKLGIISSVTIIIILSAYFLLRPKQVEPKISPELNPQTSLKKDIPTANSHPILTVKTDTIQNPSTRQERSLQQEDTIEKMVEHNKNTVSTQETVHGATTNYESITPRLKKGLSYTLDTTRDTLLIGKEGTRIYIPANAFVHKNTQDIVYGQIHFTLNEYFSLSDMILANLSTKTEKALLETGGMIHLTASQNNTELVLSKPVEIRFPKVIDRNYQLFSGQLRDQEIVWDLEKTKIDSSIVYAKKGILSRDSISFYSSRTIKWDTIYRSVRSYKTTIREILHLPNLEIDSALMEQFNDYEKQKLIRFKNNKETVILRKPLLETNKDLFKIIDGDSVSRGGNIIRKRWGSDKIPGELIQQIVPGNEGNSSFPFHTLKLGWINCDQFVNLNTPKIKYKIKIKNSEGATIKLVFKNQKTILNSVVKGDFYDFGDIPKDAPIYLIGIKKLEDEYYLGTLETYSNTIDSLKMKFEKYDSDNFIKELKKLNQLFNN